MCAAFLWPARFSWLFILALYTEDYLPITNSFDYTAVAEGGKVGFVNLFTTPVWWMFWPS